MDTSPVCSKCSPLHSLLEKENQKLKVGDRFRLDFFLNASVSASSRKALNLSSKIWLSNWMDLAHEIFQEMIDKLRLWLSEFPVDWCQEQQVNNNTRRLLSFKWYEIMFTSREDKNVQKWAHINWLSSSALNCVLSVLCISRILGSWTLFSHSFTAKKSPRFFWQKSSIKQVIAFCIISVIGSFPLKLHICKLLLCCGRISECYVSEVDVLIPGKRCQTKGQRRRKPKR